MTEASETRRARGTFDFEGADGTRRSGEADLEITDDGVVVDGLVVEFLDADGFSDADRVLTLSLFPKGALRLSQLARRHDTFSAALAEARDRARVAGLLAHGVTAPATFTGCVRTSGGDADANLLVYATHLTVVPKGSDPFQIPFGTVTSIRFEEEAWNVVVEVEDGSYAFGRLGRRTEMFARELSAAREAGEKRLAATAGGSGFADGRGVPASSLEDLDRLLEAFTAPERVEGAAAILSAGDRSSARIGLVELLDPDENALAAKTPLPENVASFLLVRVKSRVVLELLSGPSAATYVFRGDVEAINRDLQAIHFRRRALSLSEKEATGTAGRSYRLAFRRLEPLKRLRNAVSARVIHDERWGEAFSRAIGEP